MSTTTQYTSTQEKSCISHNNSTMVAARIPRGIKEQGDAILREINSSATELINSAYSYLIANKVLPQTVTPLNKTDGGLRKLSASQLKVLKDRVSKTTFSVPESHWISDDYKEDIEAAVREKYEALS